MLKTLISNFLWIGLLLTLAHRVNAQKTESDLTISIGLLVNEMNEKQAIASANKVVKRFNDSGGVHGKKLKLQTRLVKGAWGAGSSQIVDLVFKDKVVGIVGALDGRNAHLAEQVIAKTQILYVSAWASDPTLSKAYVSWYFSVVPTDDQQAKVLTEDIYRNHQSGSRILVIHDGSYDANQSLKSFRSSISKNQNFTIHSLEILPLSEPSEWYRKISAFEMDLVVAFGTNLPILKINENLQGTNGKAPVMYFNMAASASLEIEDLISQRPDNIRYISNDLATNSKKPSSVEDFVQDGVSSLITAIKNTDANLTSMQKVMSEINFQGVTGQIEFDELGRLKNAETQLKITTP